MRHSNLKAIKTTHNMQKKTDLKILLLNNSIIIQITIKPLKNIKCIINSIQDCIQIK